MIYRFIAAFLVTFICFLGFSASFSQTINRVSIAERSDGLGFVLRMHNSSAPDSFKIIQSSPEFVQILVYGRNIRFDAPDISLRQPFISITPHELPDLIGIDIELEEESTYLSRIYIDQNRRDVLVGLTRVSKTEIERFTAGFAPVDWHVYDPVKDIEELLADETDVSDFVGSQADHEPISRSTIKFDTIVIDPGHGGRDPGAIGFRGTYEKDVALAIAKRVGVYIEQYLPELNVVYTRTTDRFVDLEERGRIANRYQGDLFISIHTNAHDLRQPHGAEFYFLGMNRTQSAFEVMKRENSVIQFEENSGRQELTEEQLLIYELSNTGYMASSRRFAELLDHQFRDRARRRSRGVKQAGLKVLWNASMPGVLVELGFISNPEEERFMTSDYGQSILASAIFRAVREYKESTARGNQNNNSNQ